MTTLDLGGSFATSRQTAHEFVREALRVAILRGSLSGGTRLVQADLARELGVSTTPVREALRDLATEGLISLDAHRGAVVKKLEYDELVEIQSLMRLLEPEAIKLATETRDHGTCLAEARKLADQMEEEADVGHWVELNRQFHEALVGCVSSRRLLGILAGLRAAAAPYIGLALQQRGYPVELANEHHRGMIESIEAGDGDRAMQLAREHVDLTTRTFEEARGAFEHL